VERPFCFLGGPIDEKHEEFWRPQARESLATVLVEQRTTGRITKTRESTRTAPRQGWLRQQADRGDVQELPALIQSRPTSRNGQDDGECG